MRDEGRLGAQLRLLAARCRDASRQVAALARIIGAHRRRELQELSSLNTLLKTRRAESEAGFADMNQRRRQALMSYDAEAPTSAAAPAHFDSHAFASGSDEIGLQMGDSEHCQMQAHGAGRCRQNTSDECIEQRQVVHAAAILDRRQIEDATAALTCFQSKPTAGFERGCSRQDIE